MLPIVSLIVVLALSLLLTRIATVALVHTGMSREMARFQARSAFSGVGFTTSEAEAVVSHPVRRRIVMWLMLVGNAGIVAAVSTLLLSFLGMGSEGWYAQAAILVGGVLLLLTLASSERVDRQLSRWISWALRRWTTLDARDYSRLLHLRDDYGIAELHVTPEDWVAERSLGEARLAGEGVLVLGVSCPGDHFVGAPGSGTPIRAGDTLIVYGRAARIEELDRRRRGGEGDRRHAEAASEQARISQDEHARAGR